MDGLENKKDIYHVMWTDVNEVNQFYVVWQTIVVRHTMVVSRCRLLLARRNLRSIHLF